MAHRPTPIQEAQVRLAAALAKAQTTPGGPGLPRQRGKTLADEEYGQADKASEVGEVSGETNEASETVSESGLRRARALVNAVAVGPDRASAADRRLMLARLLAQRRQREDGRIGQWTALAKRLIGEIEALEAECAEVPDLLPPPPLTASDQQVTAEVRRQRMDSVEGLLHGLDRTGSALAVRRRDLQQATGDDTENSPAEKRGGQDDN